VLGLAAHLVAARTPGFERYLERVEERFPVVRSWLRNALDLERETPVGASDQLAAAVRAETVKRLDGLPLAALAPRPAPARPAGAIALAALLLAGAAALFPARVQRSWAALLDPSAAAPPVRLAVEPGSVRVTPGATLAIRARVWGTGAAPRLLREAPGAAPAVDEGAGPDGARRWRFDLAPLTRDEEYRVRVAAVESPRYRISMAGEPAPLAFEVEVRAPDYARLPVQRGASTSGDLAALRGSRARVEVTFDRDLESLDATLPGGAAAAFQPVTPRRWRGEVAIAREGPWELHARAARGEGRFRYRVTPLADAPPVLAVRVPEGDVSLPAGQVVPLEVVGQDDLGLSELELEFRKDPAAPWTRVPLARFPQAPREAEVAARWDAAPLALLPGEAATFRVVLWDNNALGRGRAVSPSFELRFPSLAELYEDVDATQRGAQRTLERVAERAEELQKSLERLARPQPQASRPMAPQASPARPQFERSEEVKAALERQQELSRQMDAAARQLRESVEQAAERRAFDDQLMRRMRELSELVQQIQSPEFRRAVEKMQQAMQNLDRRQMEQNLSEWRDRNRELLEQLERSIELLKRLREEERLAALAERAEELERRQEALNREHDAAAERREERRGEERRESPERDAKGRESEPGRTPEERRAAAERERAERQEQAARESERLAQDAEQAAAELSEEAEQRELEEAARELEVNAAPEQREASEQTQQGQAQRARQKGRSAQQSLQRAAQRMRQMVSQRQQEREGVDLAAVRRAARDLVSLQREAEHNLRSGDSPDRRADRSTDLSEGVARVADSLGTLAQRTPFLSENLGRALGRAMDHLRSAGRELAGGNRQRADESGRQGAEALNEAVLELRQGEQNMCQQPGTGRSGQQKSMAQQMGEMGERQSDLNRRTRTLAQRLSEQMEMGAGDPEELRRLAEEQARIREQIERIAEQDEREQKLLGRLDQVQREMREVEETLAAGGLTGELEEKQIRILSRMLDAQRSINRRDFDPARESRPGVDVVRRSPGELPADLLRSTDRLRLDLLKAEADRYPAQYRAFIESYLRTLNGASR
jgi:hypothetical protein